jgi:cell division protein FtsW
MESQKVYDRLLLAIVFIFVIIGIVMVYSSSSISAADKCGTDTYYLKKQIAFAVLGFLMLFLARCIRYQLLKKCVYLILVVSVVSLILVLVPGLGKTIGGATRWLRVGPVSFQPSEFAKLGLVIFLAYSLSRKEDRMKSFSVGFLPHLLITLLMFGLVLKQPDFGTAMLMIMLFLLLVFAGGGRLKHLASFFALAAAGGYLLITATRYRMDRLTAFYDPWKDASDTGFQIIQSFLALGSGGLWGTGLGNGRQKLFYLPEPHTDFIFSILGEELGFIGACFIILLFGLLIYCGIKICLKAPDLFGTYLALGITAFIGLHAAINLGVVMGLLPTKGSTLPFISYGGTSLVINLTSMGILLNIGSQPSMKTKL